MAPGIGQEFVPRKRRVAVLPAGLQVEEEQAQGLHLVHGVVLPVVVSCSAGIRWPCASHRRRCRRGSRAGEEAREQKSCEQYLDRFHAAIS